MGGAGESPSLLPRTEAKEPFSTQFSSVELSTSQRTERPVLQQWAEMHSLTQASSSPHTILQGTNIFIQRQSATYLWPHNELAAEIFGEVSKHAYAYFFTEQAATQQDRTPVQKGTCDQRTEVMDGIHWSNIDSLHWQRMCLSNCRHAAASSQTLKTELFHVATSGQGESLLKTMYFSAPPLNRACDAQTSCRHQPCRLTGYLHLPHPSQVWCVEHISCSLSQHEDIDL